MEVSDLSTEAARLRGVLESGFDFLRREIRSSSETISTQIGALMQSTSRALEQLDTIRLILLAQHISSQAPRPSRPFARIGTSIHGRGRRGQGCARGFLSLLIISLTLLMPPAMTSIRSRIVNLFFYFYLGSILWPLYFVG